MTERMTVSEARDAMNGRSTPNKYGAKKVYLDGFVFDSVRESRHYLLLKHRQRAGEISNLTVHPKFDLSIDGRPLLIRSKGFPNGRKATCKWDFGFFDNQEKRQIYHDVKGVPTEAYRLRRAVFEALYYPAKVIEV